MSLYEIQALKAKQKTNIFKCLYISVRSLNGKEQKLILLIYKLSLFYLGSNLMRMHMHDWIIKMNVLICPEKSREK